MADPKPTRNLQVPGEPIPPNPAEALAALNNTNEDPNMIAAQHEALVASRTASAMLEKGDAKGAMALLEKTRAAVEAAMANGAALVVGVNEAATMDLSEFGEEVESISVPVIRRSPDVDKYGPELTYPVGTQLGEDKQPIAGNQVPVYVVANILIKGRGWLVGRAVRLQGVPAPLPPAAAAAA